MSGSALSSSLVPVTVIGGYLGAGKTTLVNQLLNADHGRRLAVLVNDFGEINVDVDLIDAHDGATVSLPNGCVCCSIGGSVGEAIDAVLALDPRPEQIVIEASGVADPAKVASFGLGWPGCRLDAVVVLADAETIRERSTDPFVGELVTRQLSTGDLVLLTKVDLLEAEAVGAVREWVEDRAGHRIPVVPCDGFTFDVAALLDTAAAPDAVTEGRPDRDLPAAVELFDTGVIELPDPISRDALEALLGSWPAQVLRAKGVVTLDDGAVVVVQRVGRRVSIEPVPMAEPACGGRLAVIVLTDSIDMASLSQPRSWSTR